MNLQRANRQSELLAHLRCCDACQHFRGSDFKAHYLRLSIIKICPDSIKRLLRCPFAQLLHGFRDQRDGSIRILQCAEMILRRYEMIEDFTCLGPKSRLEKLKGVAK